MGSYSFRGPPAWVFDAPREDLEARSKREIFSHFWRGFDFVDKAGSSTLQASAANPDAIGYVLLYYGANPKWKSNNMIFAKTNLGILPVSKTTSNTPASGSSSFEPAALTDPTPAPHTAFAVFEQLYPSQSEGPDKRVFYFAGWYRVAELNILEPHSEALTRMLRRKWEVVDQYGRVAEKAPNPKAREASLRHRWAIIQMELDKRTMKEKKAPQIDKIEEAPPILSVSEMLQELSLGEGAGEGAQQDNGSNDDNADDSDDKKEGGIELTKVWTPAAQP